MRIIGFTGYSGAGKTTLLLKVIPKLIEKGFSVSTLKHAHHMFDVDVKGKDSYEHREAGASEVLVSSKNRFALMSEFRGEQEPQLHELLLKLKPVDFVIIEGFKNDNHAKILIHRSANDKPLLEGLSQVVAVVSDEVLANNIALDNSDGVVEAVLKYAEPLNDYILRAKNGATHQ